MDNRIVSVDIVDGELIVTYQDGSTESLGPVAELDPEELSAAVLKNAGDIVDLKRAVSALQTSVTALDTAVGAAETSIDSLEAEVGAIKNDFNQLLISDELDNPLNHIINSTINFSNKYVVISTQRGLYIPIQASDHIQLTKGSATGYYACLKNIDGHTTNGAVANLCDTFSTVKAIGNNGVDIIAPSDATYLWIYVSDANTNYLPSKIVINNLDVTIGLTRSVMSLIQENESISDVASENANTLSATITKILRNGVDADNVETGKYWSRDDGVTLLPNSGYNASTTYCPVVGGATYRGVYALGSFTNFSVTWYDKDKKFISGAFQGASFTAPENARFVRLSWSTSGINESELLFTQYTIDQIAGYTNNPYLYGYDYIQTDNIRDIQRITGKKLCATGDSICYGVGYTGGYPKLLAEANDMTVQNLGISGAVLCTGVDGHSSVYSTLSNFDADGDYYIIEGGFNDYNQNVPLFAEGGSFVERIPETPNGITTNIYDCMENLCYQLNVAFRGKKVGFVFPHKISYVDWTVNSVGATYKDYKDLQKKVLTKYAIPYIDLSEVSGMNTRYAEVANAYTHNGDYVHPNLLGYKTYYVPKINAWMNAM